MNTPSPFQHSGLRDTPNRRRVLAVLQHSAAPLSARQVWQALGAERCGFATVYRTLSALTDAGLVRKILSEHNALYEHAEDDHAPQLVCSRCGKVEEVTDPTLLQYNASTMKQRGLNEQDALTLYANCRRKECDDK